MGNTNRPGTQTRYRASGGLEAILALGAIALLTFALYGAALHGRWCCDDPAILKFALERSPTEYFVAPGSWRSLTPSSLTPWLALSYDVDHALFRFDAVGYHMHNLVAVALCAWLIYLVARQFTGRTAAGCASLAFLAGSPVAITSQQLMTRHYVEGLLFSLLAAWLFVRGIDRRSRAELWLAALACAIAATAKEVYVPLALVLLALPVGDFRGRISIGWPLLIVPVAYVPWRRYMLGDFIGGYRPLADQASFGWLDIFARFADAMPTLFDPVTPAVFALLALAAMAIWLAFARADHASRASVSLFASAIAAALLVPLVPVAAVLGFDTHNARLLLPTWAVISLALAACLDLVMRRGLALGRIAAPVLGAGILWPAWHASSQALDWVESVAIEHHAHAVALTEAGAGDAVMLSESVPVWFVRSIVGLRSAMGRTDAPPALLVDGSALSSLDRPVDRLLRFDPAMGRMLDVSGQRDELVARWRDRLRALPMQVDIEFDALRRQIRWRLVPHSAGSYVLLEEAGVTPLLSSGAVRIERLPTGCFRIRAEAPDRSLAYSAPLELAPGVDGSARVSWSGNGDLFDRGGSDACVARSHRTTAGGR